MALGGIVNFPMGPESVLEAYMALQGVCRNNAPPAHLGGDLLVDVRCQYLVSGVPDMGRGTSTRGLAWGSVDKICNKSHMCYMQLWQPCFLRSEAAAVTSLSRCMSLTSA